MSLKPVSGKIESQELNDNFSYLESRKSDLDYVVERDKRTNERIDRILIESGDANAEVEDSKRDYSGRQHDLLRQRLDSDMGLALGINAGKVVPKYKNGRLVKVDEFDPRGEIVRSVALIYQGNDLTSIAETVGDHDVRIKIKQKNGTLTSIEKDVV